MAGMLWLAGRIPIGTLNFRSVAGAFVFLTLFLLLAAFMISTAERESGGRGGVGSISATYRSPSLLSKIIQGPFTSDALDSSGKVASFYAQSAPPPVRQAQAKDSRVVSSPASSEGNYRGLPVRALLPEGSSRISLGVEMLPATNAAIRVLVVSVAWVRWLKILALASAAFLVYRHRREILDGIREGTDRVKQNVSPLRPAASGGVELMPSA